MFRLNNFIYNEINRRNMNEIEIHNSIDKILDDNILEIGSDYAGIEQSKTDEVANELTTFVMNNFVLDIVSKPLSKLKKLLAEMTIELITTEQECRERHQLIRNIETAKESINALK